MAKMEPLCCSKNRSDWFLSVELFCSGIVFGLFNNLLGELASSKHFYKEEQPGIHFQAGFSVKIENRKLGDVAAMEGSLRWHEDDQTDIVEFFLVERDCNRLDLDNPFGRHKVVIKYRDQLSY